MTLEQVSSFTEDELAMILYIINHIQPTDPHMEIPVNGLVWFKKGVVEKKIMDSFQKVKPEYHSLFSSILNKLGIEHEIRYEVPASGSATPASGSV
jgi:hypothetical protein